MSVPDHQVIQQSSKKMKPKRIWIALILGFLASIPPFATDFYLPALPQMTLDLSTNASLVQLSLTACLLGMALGQFVIGPYSDVWGRRVPLTVSLVYPFLLVYYY